MALVTEEINNKLGNKTFEKKKPILETVPWIKPDVEDKKDWTGEQITERAANLAKIAREKVWRL